MSGDGEEIGDSPQVTRNPSPPPELCQNDEVHGDSIGQTAFSKHWLFTTLMKLIQEVDKENEGKEAAESEFGVDVDEDLQNELCKLWDMSMNPEVASFLDEFKAVEILTGVIAKSKAPRVTEICVGILGNMACDKEICKVITACDKLVKMIVMMVENPDPPTLVETTRLVYTCLSNREAGSTWITSIKSDSTFFTNICFILHSSTNTDLLKNTGECVDALLDQDEELCGDWATQDLVESLLEAVKQIGYSHSETLETFMHIFQLLSTSEAGVTALVLCADVLQIPLLKYLLGVCEYEIVGLDGHEDCLASALSVLNVLYSSSPDVVDKLSSAPDLIRILLKILEPLFPLLPENTETLKTVSRYSKTATIPPPPDKSTGEESSENGHTSKDTDDTEDGGDKQMSIEGVSSPAPTESHTTEAEVHKYRLLYGVLKDFLHDVVVSLVTDDDDAHDAPTPPLFISVLNYLNSNCSRARINYMLLSFHNVKHSDVDLTDHLFHLCQKYSQDRLRRIVQDFKEGEIFFRSDSLSVEEKR
ncbi:protein saal1-like [Haliotis rufescens]|uniref:protein saal1-like n=1 Tax=Haliotis rufescens TaxID=6454 RepID=UPI00201F0C7C|nr:protein saal1-like [Haliotis rufescens]